MKMEIYFPEGWIARFIRMFSRVNRHVGERTDMKNGAESSKFELYTTAAVFYIRAKNPLVRILFLATFFVDVKGVLFGIFLLGSGAKPKLKK